MKSIFELVAAKVFLLSLICFAVGGAKVTEISIRESAGSSAVHIGGTEIPKPVGQWDDGAIIFQVPAELAPEGLTLRPADSAILSLSYAKLNGGTSIAIRPAVVSDPKIEKSDDGWLISFKGKARHDKPSDDVLCSLQVADMDPARILQSLSAQTGANLVLLTKPETKLTIRLTHVPLSEMIRHICAMCDLSFVRVDKAYLIATADKLKAGYPAEWKEAHPPAPVEPVPTAEMATETYDTSFVSGEEIVKALDKIYTGKSVSFVAGPSPLRTDIGSQDAAKATGTSTTILAQASITDSSARLVVITGERKLVASALAMARYLDKPRRQVSIAVTIHDISNDALEDMGVNWHFSDVTVSESNPNGIKFGSFTRSPLSFNATLSALVSNGKSKLLASPNVSVMDNEHAFVLIGDRINYPVLVGYSQNNAPIFSKEEERVGIYLQVTASIGQDGTVTLSLYPQISTITGYLTVNGASYPQISTREAQTTLRIGSGDTIVMGGLYSDEEIASVEKVPFLSQIPLLGAIFQHRKVTKTKSQVIITVTPTIIAEKTK